jgi:hypothetical protein
MGAIKDLIDLCLELEKRTTDRKVHDALLPIKNKILDFERAQFELEKMHSEEVSKLNIKIEAFEKEISNLKSSGNKPVASVDFF